MPRVLIPLPDRDFDTTEVAVPWKLFRDAGIDVVFATENGGVAPSCDPLLLTGVLFGQLGAEAEPKRFYEELTRDAAFQSPLAWRDLAMSDYDALVLPGGHAPGMKQYLGSALLQSRVVEFNRLGRVLAAICHGPVLAARAVDPATGHSVLHGRRTTCLPAYMERIAYWISAWKLGRYYRTYPDYVAAEVGAALAAPEHLVRGPIELMNRGTATDDRAAFVVEDGNYISARWPGDAYLFAKKIIAKL